MDNKTTDRVHEAQKVTWVGFFVNLCLTAAKITAGLFGNSAAMMADGVHSLSDFATDIIVIVFVKVSGKDKDDDHPYGHGKYETFATLIIALSLGAVGIGILIGGVEKIIDVINGNVIQQPGIIALVAAIVSIGCKEWLFRYTKKVGERIKNQAVVANGWHHRSDAFSSVGTALGIAGAIFLGESWRVLDPLAGVVVSIFIIKVAVELGIPSVKELLESSLSKETIDEIIRIIQSHPDVLSFHHLRTRKIGPNYAIDVHIKLDSEISFVHSHDVATAIERKLRDAFGNQTELNIHTEPYYNK